MVNQTEKTVGVVIKKIDWLYNFIDMLGMKNGFQLLSRLLLSDRTENTDDVLQYSKILKNSAMNIARWTFFLFKFFFFK